MVVEKIYFIILAICFIVHNVEECLLFKRMQVNYLKIIGKKLNDFYVFLYATIILDVIVICILLVYYLFPHKIFNIAPIIVVYGIFFNAIQHLCLSLICKKIMPGSITATIFLIPIATLCLIKIYKSINISLFATACYLIFSLGFMALFIYLSLWVGYFITKLIHIIGGKNG